MVGWPNGWEARGREKCARSYCAGALVADPLGGPGVSAPHSERRRRGVAAPRLLGESRIPEPEEGEVAVAVAREAGGVTQWRGPGRCFRVAV